MNSLPMQSGGARTKVLCAGLYSSASTWAFNVVIREIGQLSDQTTITRYADKIDDTTRHIIDHASSFVLKTHLPEQSLVDLCRSRGLSVILTVRDPRDATASLMERFRMDFLTALRHVEQSANLLLRLWEGSKTLVLKYEGDSLGTQGIRKIAACLNLALEAEIEQSIVNELSAPVVASHISDLIARGVFSGKDPALEWEPGTHWHPFHVGNGRVGKFSDVLSTAQHETVLFRTEPFCKAFGYDLCRRNGIPIKTNPGDRTPSVGWVDGFIPPDLVLGWARLSRGGRARIVAVHGRTVIGKAVADRFRPDLLGVKDACFGFQLRLAVPFELSKLRESVRFRMRGSHEVATDLKSTLE